MKTNTYILSFVGKREFRSNLDTTSPLTGRGLANQYVTTNRRNTDAIRVEIVEAAYNFLAERLDPEQDAVLMSMKSFLSARGIQDFITSGMIYCLVNCSLVKMVPLPMKPAHYGIQFLMCHIFPQVLILDVPCQFDLGNCYQSLQD